MQSKYSIISAYYTRKKLGVNNPLKLIEIPSKDYTLHNHFKPLTFKGLDVCYTLHTRMVLKMEDHHRKCRLFYRHLQMDHHLHE